MQGLSFMDLYVIGSITKTKTQYLVCCSTFSIGNHMISSAIWNKQVRVNFSKTNKIARARRREIFSCILLVLVSSLSKCILRALLHFCRILDVCENDVFTFCVQREKLDLGTAREQKLISRLLEQQQGL